MMDTNWGKVKTVWKGGKRQDSSEAKAKRGRRRGKRTEESRECILELRELVELLPSRLSAQYSLEAELHQLSACAAATRADVVSHLPRTDHDDGGERSGDDVVRLGDGNARLVGELRELRSARGGVGDVHDTHLVLLVFLRELVQLGDLLVGGNVAVLAHQIDGEEFRTRVAVEARAAAERLRFRVRRDAFLPLAAQDGLIMPVQERLNRRIGDAAVVDDEVSDIAVEEQEDGRLLELLPFRTALERVDQVIV